MNWRRALIAVIIVAVVVAAGVFAYRQFFVEDAPENAVTAAAVSASRADTIAIAAPTGTVSAEGQVIPARHAQLALAGTGQIAHILVPEGEAVAEGQPILRLDAADQEIALAQAQAALAQAQANAAAAQAGIEAAGLGVEAAELGVESAAAQLALLTADPRDVDIALQEASVALAEARIAQAAAAQGLVLEGVPDSSIRAAEAELRAAEAAAIPARLQLEQLRLQENPDEDALTQAQRNYNAALAGIDAARVTVDELRSGATSAQRAAAGSGVAAATAQRDAAQAELDLLLSGSRVEQVRIAEAGIAQAEAALAEAQLRVNQTRAAEEQARAGVAQAEAAVASAQAALDDRTLVAPFAGIVADLLVDVGEVVTPGAPVAVVAELGNWVVETTDLLELDVVSVAVGMPVEVTADALPDETMTGTVTNISTLSQDVRGDTTYVVTIALDEAEVGPLRWGMTVFINIDTQ